MPAKNVKVSVPQEEGVVALTRHGERVEYEVKDGAIAVPEEELDRVLLYVPGAEVAGNSSSSSSQPAAPAGGS